MNGAYHIWQIRQLMRGTLGIGAYMVLLLLISCGKDNNILFPKSGGRPYEVVVEKDVDSLLYYILSADVDGLPQREPSFDVLPVTDQQSAAYARLARNIVRLNIDPQHERPQIRYRTNVEAQPQIRVHINTPSKEALLKVMPAIGKQLRMLLNRSEMNMEISRLRKHHLDSAQQTIQQEFGAKILIPQDLTATKKGNAFRWLSNNSAAGLKSICLYTYPSRGFSKKEFTDKRDSIMKRNIPGELPEMYMTTVRTGIQQQVVREKTGERVIIRGLWEMNGDMMGGPFVAHVLFDSIHARMIVAEAFVYAPESKKRNKIKQLEAALYTLIIQNNGR